MRQIRSLELQGLDDDERNYLWELCLANGIEYTEESRTRREGYGEPLIIAAIALATASFELISAFLRWRSERKHNQTTLTVVYKNGRRKDVTVTIEPGKEASLGTELEQIEKQLDKVIRVDGKKRRRRSAS